jgi:hypothetical protein
MNKGEDITVQIPIAEYPSNVPVDLNDAAVKGIAVRVYQEKGKYIEQFSKVTASGFTDLTITGGDNDIIEMNFKRSKFYKYLDKKLYADVKIVFTDTDFENNERHSIIAGVEIDMLSANEVTDLTVPV